MEDRKLTEISNQKKEQNISAIDEENSKFDELERMVNEEIESWSPNEGDVLIGTFQDKREGTGKFGSTLYVIKKPDGTLSGVWGSTVIKGKLDNAKIGSKIAIKYLGMAKGEMGNYKNYRVIVEEE